jgi:hypothetical protein
MIEHFMMRDVARLIRREKQISATTLMIAERSGIPRASPVAIR